MFRLPAYHCNGLKSNCPLSHTTSSELLCATRLMQSFFWFWGGTPVPNSHDYKFHSLKNCIFSSIFNANENKLFNSAKVEKEHTIDHFQRKSTFQNGGKNLTTTFYENEKKNIRLMKMMGYTTAG